MTGSGTRVVLSRGLVNGSRIQHAVIRPLTGRDEELLTAAWEAGGTEPTAATVTRLLARCVVLLAEEPPSFEALRALCVGDREALLLHLRRLTLGDRVDCVAVCPDAACGERLDLTLSVQGLLVERGEAVEWYEETFPSASPEGEVAVRFRVPTGADQEETAGLAATDPTAAARAILRRCVASSSGLRGGLNEVPDDVADAVAARMAELDPQAEIRLRFDCAACGRPVEMLFDTGAFFLAEIEATADRLLQEVHAIAWHYHWPEREILDLPRARRRQYLELIASSLSARSRGVA
jgi:hypothetical protein